MNSGKYTMTFVMLSIFVVMVGIASRYPPDARFMPFLIGIPAIALCLLQLFLDMRDSNRAGAAVSKDTRSEIEKAQEEIARIAGRKIDFESAPQQLATVERTADPAELRRREIILWAYFVGLVGGVLLFGFLLTLPVFLAIFLRGWAKTSWRFALALAAAASIVLYAIFIQGLRVVPHTGFVIEYVLERLG